MLFLWYPPKEAPGVVWDVIRGSIYDQDWASGLSYTNKLLQKTSCSNFEHMRRYLRDSRDNSSHNFYSYNKNKFKGLRFGAILILEKKA